MRLETCLGRLVKFALNLGVSTWFVACGSDDSISTRKLVDSLQPDAGPDRTVIVGDTVTLDGSASTGSGKRQQLQWQSLSERIQLAEPEAVMTTFTTSVVGVFPFLLWMSSDGDNWVSDHVVITVKESEQPPTDLGRTLRIAAGFTAIGIDPASVEDVRFLGDAPGIVIFLDAFEIDKYEVTNFEYQEFLTATSRTNGFGELAEFSGDLQPAVGMQWDEAQAYCASRGKRLPTEFEWERAARGFNARVASTRLSPITGRLRTAFNQAADLNAFKQSKAGDTFKEDVQAMLDDVVSQGVASALYPWGGASPDAAQANFGGDISGNVRRTVEVGSYPLGRSREGALDMAGNVWEWTGSWLEEQPGRRLYEDLFKDTASNLKRVVQNVEKGKRSNAFPVFSLEDIVLSNPEGAEPRDEDVAVRVIRGGSWIDGDFSVRSTTRGAADPATRTSNIGFRCAR